MDFENVAIGVDIEDIDRFINKDEIFLNRLFTPLERDYCKSKISPHQHFAARYCAKEAIFKALSAFGESGIEFKLIEIYHNNKIPCVRFLSELNEKYQVKLSLSHDKTKAVAYVIIRKKED